MDDDSPLQAIQHVADLSSDSELDRAWAHHLGEPTLVVDEEGRIARANEEAVLFLGYPRLELLGQRVEMLVPDGFRDLHTAHRDRYMTYPQPRQMASRQGALAVRTKTGREIPVAISLKPFTVSSGRYIAVVIRLREEIRG